MRAIPHWNRVHPPVWGLDRLRRLTADPNEEETGWVGSESERFSQEREVFLVGHHRERVGSVRAVFRTSTGA